MLPRVSKETIEGYFALYNAGKGNASDVVKIFHDQQPELYNFIYDVAHDYGIELSSRKMKVEDIQRMVSAIGVMVFTLLRKQDENNEFLESFK